VWKGENDFNQIPKSHSFASVVLFIISINIFLLAITTGVANTRQEYIEVDPYEQAKNYYACSTPGVRYWAPMSILWALELLLSFYGVWLSYRLRKVNYRVYNESSVIAFAMY